MNNESILSTLEIVFKDVLDVETITLNSNTTAKDIEEWDSLTHIHLVVSIEKKFKIKFTSMEIQSWNKVGDIVDAIGSKI
jgi:acyl carrier protein